MKHYHFGEISSTNDYANHLLDIEDEVVVTAEFQTKGRGRNEKTWFGSIRCNLYFSYGIRHKSEIDYEKAISYQFVGCLAAYDLMKNIAPDVIFKLKYPNDIYAKTADFYKKICGVLVEHTFSGEKCVKSIIGIGINVQQCEFPIAEGINPTSLALLGVRIEPEQLIQPLTNNIKNYLQMSSEYVFEKWAYELKIEGKIVNVLNREGFWIAQRVLPTGQIELLSIDNKETILIDNSDSIRYELD